MTAHEIHQKSVNCLCDHILWEIEQWDDSSASIAALQMAVQNLMWRYVPSVATTEAQDFARQLVGHFPPR